MSTKMDVSMLTRLGFVRVDMANGAMLQRLYDEHSVLRIVRDLQETAILVSGIEFDTDDGSTVDRRTVTLLKFEWNRFVRDVIASLNVWGFVCVTTVPSNAIHLTPRVLAMSLVTVWVRFSIDGTREYLVFPLRQSPSTITDTDRPMKVHTTIWGEAPDPDQPLANVVVFDDVPPAPTGKILSRVSTVVGEVRANEEIREIYRTASWLGAVPPVLEDPVESMTAVDASIKVPLARDINQVATAESANLASMLIDADDASLSGSRIQHVVRKVQEAAARSGLHGRREANVMPQGTLSDPKASRVGITPGNKGAMAPSRPPVDFTVINAIFEEHVSAVFQMPRTLFAQSGIPSHLGTTDPQKSLSGAMYYTAQRRLRDTILTICNRTLDFVHDEVAEAPPTRPDSSAKRMRIQLSGVMPLAVLAELFEEGILTAEGYVKQIVATFDVSEDNMNKRAIPVARLDKAEPPAKRIKRTPVDPPQE